MAKNKYLTIRVNDDIDMQLHELCTTWGLNKTQVIERLIYGEYVRSTQVGKEQIQSVLNDLKNLNDKLKRIGENVQ